MANHIECESNPFCLMRNPANLASLAVKNKNGVDKSCNAFSSLGSVQFLPPIHITAEDQDLKDQVRSVIFWRLVINAPFRCS